jgi:hypothetical protein
MNVKKSDIKIIHNMALRLKQKIIDTVCSTYTEKCCREICLFGEHGCAQFDADTIINACREVLNDRD